jgi:rod shape-determining protein MreB and related proteins
MRVIDRSDGIVFDEPSLCCFSRQHGFDDLVAAGAEARAMVDRTPRNLQIKRPLCRGVLQDIDAARELLRFALLRTHGRKHWRSLKAIIGVPADATQAERSAMLTAANDAGIGKVALVTEPLAAAIGAQLPVEEPAGSMVIECGAGTTEVAVFALGGICASGSVRIGGSTLDRAMADHLHLNHKFLIGDLTAEQLKLDYIRKRQGSGGDPSGIITIRGRCLLEGLPKSMDVEVSKLNRIVEKHVDQIVRVVRDVLGRTDPELSRDIHEHGVVLTGGGAVNPLFSTMIAAATGLHIRTAERPAQCVGNGLHRMLAG